MSQSRVQRPFAVAVFVFTLVSAWIWAGRTHAFSSLFESVSQDGTPGGTLPVSHTNAIVEDRSLIGTGSERLRRLPDGRLRIDRLRHYTRIRHPEKGNIVALPTPWEATGVLIVEPSLRL